MTYVKAGPNLKVGRQERCTAKSNQHEVNFMLQISIEIDKILPSRQNHLRMTIISVQDGSG